MSLSNARVLVTGATGFIGSRLVQWLVEVEKANVVAFVHQFKNASRISRFPIEMIQGDVSDLSSLTVAMQGCTHAVHAAVSFVGTTKQNRRITVEGARNVYKACRRNGIQRVVYLSTISVYGKTPAGAIDESTPCSPIDSYGRDKLDAEAIFREADGTDFKPVVLRLPVVYGPWSFWSKYPMEQFCQGAIILPDDGSGICNAMYVDDAIQCIICALHANTDLGSVTCLVSGPDRITWRQFYEEHGKARGDNPARLRYLPKTTILRHSKWYKVLPRHLWSLRGEALIVLRMPGVRIFLRALKSIDRGLRKRQVAPFTVPVTVPAPDIQDIWPNPAHLELMASQSLIENRITEKLIGFRPTVSFADGMEKTRSWLLWAGLNYK